MGRLSHQFTIRAPEHTLVIRCAPRKPDAGDFIRYFLEDAFRSQEYDGVSFANLQEDLLKSQIHPVEPPLGLPVMNIAFDQYGTPIMVFQPENNLNF